MEGNYKLGYAVDRTGLRRLVYGQSISRLCTRVHYFAHLSILLKVVNYFCKTFHLKCLTGFWIRHWYVTVSCCTNFMLIYFRVTFFLNCFFLMLYSFHVSLLSCCTFSFHVSYLAWCSFLSCNFFMLHSFILRFFIFFHVVYFLLLLFSGCIYKNNLECLLIGVNWIKKFKWL